MRKRIWQGRSTTRSEFCIVYRDVGMKRKQRLLKVSGKPRKVTRSRSISRVTSWCNNRMASKTSQEVPTGVLEDIKDRKVCMETWESLMSPYVRRLVRISLNQRIPVSWVSTSIHECDKKRDVRYGIRIKAINQEEEKDKGSLSIPIVPFEGWEICPTESQLVGKGKLMENVL